MPIIAIIKGMKVYMNYSLDEHNPPHIHGVINDRRCSVSLNGDVLEGKQFPKKLLNELVKFVLSHKEELTKMWEEQKFTKLN
jgi:hypothetical protein